MVVPIPKKYYAVKKGKQTGIFTTWDACKQQVHGYSGASYKSFTSKAEAEKYLRGNHDVKKSAQSNSSSRTTDMIAYVDGSFHKASHAFSYGAVIFFQGEQYEFAEKFHDPDLALMRNVAGELKGAEKAMSFAVEKGVASVSIYHDYEGIAKWCTGEWQAKKPGTISYKQYFETVNKDVQIQFVKVKGHSGDEYNDLADQLAKKALNIL